AHTDEDMFTDRDGNTEYEEDESVSVLLNGDSIQCSSSSVKIDGTTVTVLKEGTYVFSGALDDGMIIVNTAETAKPQLVFDGVNINSSSSAALYVLEADKVFITLAENSENTLSNGGEFIAIDENNIDAVVFSKQDITFNGNGNLTVTSPAGHGIVSKDDLVFTGGIYNITSASHGIDANDSVRVSDSSFTVDSGKDGIHAENNDDATLGFVYISSGSFNIESEGDGISASSNMQIVSGNFNILTGGGSVNASRPSSDGWGEPGGRPDRPGGRPGGRSAETSSEESTSIKGLKSVGGMLIEGGTFKLNTADDSVHSNLSVTGHGGTFDISAGDDAFHADEALTVNTGTINITDSYEGLEALNVTVNGGDINVVASDDGINAAGGTDSSGMGGMRPGGDMFGGANSKGSIVISGGNIYINASGDGIDANGTLTITGGHVTVCGPTKGDTAVLDYDKTATISGGTFIGTGSSMMAQTISSSNQGVIALSVGNQSAGTKITVTDTDGNVILSYEPKLSFAIFIISTPDIVKGKEYSVTVGSQTGEFKAN
ncbi:MAG: carbohydrate-binding domain-containing protein, partial [Clostridia bacterium]|nr:carbohydrate-binding domain-containing protein [Clostridia bacterium]